MSMGEPKCGSCGSDLMAGMFHHCKPAWDEENQKLRVVIDTLTKELQETRTSDEESLKLYRAARDRADASNVKVRELIELLMKRRAMEPKHSREDHECEECNVLAEIGRTRDGFVQKGVGGLCWCAAKAEAPSAVCPIHG